MKVLVPTLLCATLLAPVATPAAAHVPAGSKFTVCNFDDPSVPVANKRYPFDFLLSTSVANTNNRKVRKAVRSVQEILRSVDIRDTVANKG